MKRIIEHKINIICRFTTKAVLVFLLTLIISLCISTKVFSREFTFLEWDLRSMPAMGFFPVGGNLKIKDSQLTSFFLGPSIDLFNLHRNHSRIAILNISGFLLGVNYSAMSNPSSDTQVLNVGYLRIGPHYRFQGFWNDMLSLGSQIGYGFLLYSRKEEGETTYLHGVDISFTFSWTKYEEPTYGESMSRNTKILLGVIAGTATGLGLLYWGTTMKEKHEDKERMSPGGAVCISFGITIAITSLTAVVMMD
jgi:hypothetical protein